MHSVIVIARLDIEILSYNKHPHLCFPLKALPKSKLIVIVRCSAVAEPEAETKLLCIRRLIVSPVKLAGEDAAFRLRCRFAGALFGLRLLLDYIFDIFSYIVCCILCCKRKMSANLIRLLGSLPC